MTIRTVLTTTKEQVMTKSERNKLFTASRTAKMWAGEAIARAAECAADDDVDGFAREMAEASRLTLIAAKRLKEYRSATID